MTQTSKRPPRSPKQAAACCRPIDDQFDPELFRALGDPTRALLVRSLVKCGRPCSVSEIAECCSVDLSVVSRHLKQLERSGTLVTHKEGRTVTYQVNFAPLCRRLRALADAIEVCCPKEPTNETARESRGRNGR